MQISTRRVGATLVVKLKGEFDLVAAEEFREEIAREFEERGTIKNLVLVMPDVSFVDSSGLGVILGRYRVVRERGGRLVLVKTQPQVRRVFELAGMFKIAQASESERDALQMV